MKITHVTEALAGGVLKSLAEITNAQINSGNEVILIFSKRIDTPKDDILKTYFNNKTKFVFINMKSEINPFYDFISIIKLIFILVHINPEIIHLHSSKAGAIGRIASFLCLKSNKTFYSPRGFSFLRKDINKRKRRLYLFMELVLSKLVPSLIACSMSEYKIAKSLLKLKKIYLAENAVTIKSDNFKKFKNAEVSSFCIGTSGRITYQKDPSYFDKIVKNFSSKHNVTFKWIGDYAYNYTENRLDNKIVVTGWKSHQDVINEVSKLDIFIMTSLWEGMPLSLIEAQKIGIPCVVRNTVGNRDVVTNGETGFICSDIESFILKLQKLHLNENLRSKMSKKAKKIANKRFDVNRLNADLTNIYENNLNTIN